MCERKRKKRREETYKKEKVKERKNSTFITIKENHKAWIVLSM